MIQVFAKILKVLNSETQPFQISLAVCFAMVMGLTPFASLHNLIVVLLVLVLRVNLSSFLVCWALFSGIAYALDPLFHITGLALLTAGPLESLWTYLYNIPIFKIARFYNTVVMGSLFISLVAFIPMYFLIKFIVIRYRQTILSWVRKSKIMQMIRLSKLYKAYTSLSVLGENS